MSPPGSGKRDTCHLGPAGVGQALLTYYTCTKCSRTQGQGGQGTFSLPQSTPGLASAFLCRALNLSKVQEKVFPFFTIICGRNNNAS